MELVDTFKDDLELYWQALVREFSFKLVSKVKWLNHDAEHFCFKADLNRASFELNDFRERFFLYHKLYKKNLVLWCMKVVNF